MQFPPSKCAISYLLDMKGIEIGAAAHNPFCLDTINVDCVDNVKYNTIYAREQRKLCGQVADVHVVAPGNKLPFRDKSYDFVISSHVIEHFYDPISALREWERVARSYIFMIVPHMDRTFDLHERVSDVDELHARHLTPVHMHPKEDGHYTFWRPHEFYKLLWSLHMQIAHCEDPDDKVGNGFIVVVDVRHHTKTHCVNSTH